MKTFICNENTGETKVSLRPYDETVSLVFMVLGQQDHPTYSTQYKASECFLEGLFIFSSNSNGDTVEGFKP
jgi:hypothetical protein